MSLSPPNLLQRLQELKMWQESHEELLKKTKNLLNTSDNNRTTASDYQSIEGLSAFDDSSDDNAKTKTAPPWESQPISPAKTFNELLQEKLAEDPGPQNNINAGKPKRPFLKKGAGLQRFRMTPGRKPLTKIINRPKQKKIEEKIEDLSIKPKAMWQKINNGAASPPNATISTPPVGILRGEEASEQTLYEKALEKELLIFEALEQKAENSSFCSTNSSVVRILSSTPSKIRKEMQQPPILEEKRVHWGPQSDDDVIETTLERKDIADILLRLKNLAQNNIPTLEQKQTPVETSSSEDDKWSTSSVDTSLSSSDLEMTIKSEKRDVAVGTTDHAAPYCQICGGKFESKLAEYENKIQEVIREKNRIESMKTELQQTKERLEEEFARKNRDFEDDKRFFMSELESEKKKLLKEKQVYQSYVKESQNRPNKREREELSNLRREVVDLKETLKLKESKNGMTQARLRNQVKQLEKDNANLKEEIEKLTKENAKLKATQKINKHRPTDTKILHEINKNITKLTQEALKSKNQDGEAKTVERQVEDKEDSLLDMANSKAFNYSDLEKQYDSTFRKQLHVSNKSIDSSDEGKNVETFRNNSRARDRTVHIQDDGSKIMKYGNGNTKIVSPDGNFIKMKFFNGDLQETNLLDGTVRYFFCSKNIWQMTHADGLEVLEYPDGTKEKRYVDGTREVVFPDDSIQTILPDGSQEIKYPDGSVVNVKNNGDKILLLPNGQKEIETQESKRREYPDGTVKILYPNGSQETRYANGRIRIKDEKGNLVLDTQT